MSQRDARKRDLREAADQVGVFYDEHPYPPPVASLDRPRRDADEVGRRRADYHLIWPTLPYRDDFDILVAGCGTSQAAQYALQWPNARVTGIDISAASLEHTDSLRRTHGLSNLRTRLLSIERACDLRSTFDLIVCTGVLHHLEDPDCGLRALHG